MAKTFWDIKNKVWNLLWQKSTSTIFSPTVVWNAINAVTRKVLRWKFTSLLDPNRIYSSGRLWIQEGSYYVRFKPSSVLTAIHGVWDINIVCDTTNLATSGYVEINWETLAYTGKTTTELTWVTWGTLEYPEGTRVTQLYQMPTSYERPFRINKIIWENEIIRQEIPFSDEGSKVVYYQIVKYWTVNLIRLIGLESEDLLEIIYSKTYTNLVNDADICLLPDDYGETLIAYLVAWQFAIEKGIPNWQSIIAAGYAELQDFYRFFDNEVYRTKHHIKPISYNYRTLK